jgi:hypothetical protein
MYTIILLIYASVMAYWFYVHYRFWRLLKSEVPDTYKKYSGFSFLAPGGFLWIEYALRRGYKELENARVRCAGENLCKAYLGFTSAVGLFVTLVVLFSILGVALFLIGKFT